MILTRHLNLNFDFKKSQNLNKLKMIRRGNTLYMNVVTLILYFKYKEKSITKMYHLKSQIIRGYKSTQNLL